MSIEIRVPTLGESVTEATIATWYKAAGDSVAADEMLCELETDKVTVEVPAPAAGTLGTIVAAEGATVGVDALLATLEEGGAAVAAPAAAPAPAPVEKSAPVAAPAKNPEPTLASADGGSVDVMVPALGESVTEATVGSWLKAVGDSVAADEMLCELETDKVSIEVPAPQAGVLTQILAAEGATVAASGKLAVIAATGASAAPAAVPATTAKPSAKISGFEDAPSAKKLMAEHNLNADQVKGTGRDGRIMKEDVLEAIANPTTELPTAVVRAAPPAALAATRAPDTPDDASRQERVRMTRLKQTMAKRLKESQNTAAQLTTYNEVDMSAIMAIRTEYKDLFLKKHGVKLGFMSFFTKACCHALFEVPEVNAEMDGTDIVYKNYVHMGVAVGTPTGLVVPVVKNAHSMSFAALEKQIGALGKKAVDGKLSMAEMMGGSFTVSNGGVYGSLMSSPIINPPQSGILGMHKIQKRPIALNGEVVIRPMMYLALSYDHRIIDGKGAVTFLVRVKEALEDPRRLLMDL